MKLELGRNNPTPFNPAQQKVEPLSLPENPLDYLKLIQQQEGIAPLNKEYINTRVAIIGGGSAGLCAAHELMRVGLTPMVFEAQSRIGGRCYTYKFKDQDSKVIAMAELGAMRIPTSQQTLFYYLEELGVKQRQQDYLIDGDWPLFPSPKAVDTRFYFRGRNFVYSVKDQSYVGDPFVIQQVNTVETKFNALLNRDLGALQALDKEYNEGNNLSPGQYQEYVGKRLALWSKVVDTYQNKSLFEVLIEYRGEMGSWSTDEIMLLGAIGIGTGGIGAVYNTAYLETLREAYHEDDRDQRLIVGGIDQLPISLWSAKRSRAHSLPIESVANLNHNQFHRKVIQIRTPENPLDWIEVTWEENGNRHKDKFPAVILTCSLRGIEMGIDINREAFSDEVWYAIRDFGMVSSQKVFFLTKTPFWNEWNQKQRDQPLKQILTTISDNTLRQSYFFDKKDFGVGANQKTDYGVALMSYSWSGQAIKFDALTEDEKKRICLNAFEEIYGAEVRDLFENQYADRYSICWDKMDGFHGAFRMANPGQYQQQQDLFQQGLGQSRVNNGLYLAGEALAWYGLSGWIEGALHSGINAALATIQRLNEGNVSPYLE